MRRTLLAALALCCLATTAQAAQGVNLRWDACLADGGVLNKDFACDTNTGSEQLYVSFELDSTVGSADGIELVMMIRTPTVLPAAWWQFKFALACRQTALQASTIPLQTGGACVDLWQGMAPGGLRQYGQFFTYDNNQYRLEAIFAVYPASFVTMEPGTEYFAMRFAIAHAKTVGAGACAGCLDPVCMGIESLTIVRPPGYPDIRIATETQQLSSAASWQGSPVRSDFVHYEPYQGGTFGDYRVISCQTTSRSQNRTWGSIKSLYP